MTQNPKPKTDTLSVMAELQRQVRQITEAERLGMLTAAQRDKMIQQIRKQLGFQDTP